MAPPPAPMDRGVVERIVDRLGEASPADGLLALAHAIDRRAGDARPPTPLVLPRLDALARADAAASRRELGRALDAELASLPAAAGSMVGPALLGSVHEALLERGQRRRRGAFYTPVDVARRLVADVVGRLDAAPTDAVPTDAVPTAATATVEGPRHLAPDGSGGDVPTICDPALGGGVFLLAAADELVSLGHDPVAVVEHGLWGSDVDPSAAAVAEAALVVWARSRGAEVRGTNVVCADPLHEGAGAWPGAPAAGFAAVVGNPPFLNQLGSGTARAAADASAMRARWGTGVYRYTDTAAIFLLVAAQLTAAGGVVSMIVPVPVLVAADADRLRHALLDLAVPEHLWIARDDVFGLGVSVCAPVLRVHGSNDTRRAAVAGTGSGDGEGDRVEVSRTLGRGFAPIAPRAVALGELRAAGTWGELVADAFGVPGGAATTSRGRLGDFCDATAGFRDQYYGLRPFVVEGGTRSSTAGGPDRWAPLVTSGLIDPARLAWGDRPCRFDGRAWQEPVVDLASLEAADPVLAAWTRARLVPKVVVATQTRVLEAAIDVDGAWFPSVPTIALVPEPDRLWHAAAVVLAPPTSAWAMNRHVGAALSADALRISAKQLLQAPLPVDDGAWDEAVGHLRVAAGATDGEAWHRALTTFGAVMARAYAAPDDVLAWWVDRLPRWR